MLAALIAARGFEINQKVVVGDNRLEGKIISQVGNEYSVKILQVRTTRTAFEMLHVYHLGRQDCMV